MIVGPLVGLLSPLIVARGRLRPGFFCKGLQAQSDIPLFSGGFFTELIVQLNGIPVLPLCIYPEIEVQHTERLLILFAPGKFLRMGEGFLRRPGEIACPAGLPQEVWGNHQLRKDDQGKKEDQQHEGRYGDAVVGKGSALKVAEGKVHAEGESKVENDQNWKELQRMNQRVSQNQAVPEGVYDEILPLQGLAEVAEEGGKEKSKAGKRAEHEKEHRIFACIIHRPPPSSTES